MEKVQDLNYIPSEKFRFANKSDFGHDKKLDTKPIGYFQDAFRRFCKNKGAVVGAIVIMVLIVFAIIGPFFTPYTPSYVEDRFKGIQPKNNLFASTNFWDGCKKKSVGELDYLQDYLLGLETGKPVIKNNKYKYDEENKLYTYRFDTYYGVGFGQYQPITKEEYEDIQRYQIESGRQVLYPVVKLSERKKISSNLVEQRQAKYYYETELKGGKVWPKFDKDGNVIVNYWRYSVNAPNLPTSAAEYHSTRIEGETGATVNGETYFYVYGTVQQGGTVEVRLDRYEHYRYRHTQVLKDGIEDPYFLFGTTSGGKDIFSCLSYGARFSFLFALVVAAVNMFVGAIWGSIAGYFGGKIDLFMERFTDILGSVPTMIIITLMRYHMGRETPQALVLFLAFFMTGWIGMAGSTRMQFYRYKNQEYVLAARTLGASDRRIMFKHIFPNAIGTLITRSALIIPSMIYSETNLTYLGIVNLEAGETTSVGVMIAAGQRDFMTYPFVAVFPCTFLVLLMLSFNLFGNGLRDAFNPSLRGSED